MRQLALLMMLSIAPAAAEPADCLPNPPRLIDSRAHNPMRFTVVERDQATALEADGVIDPGTAERLGAALREERVEEIWLNSSGGDLSEALEMGRILRRSGSHTRVRSGSICVGACAEVFLGGLARFVDGGGLLGFSAVPLSDPTSNQSQAEREQAAARWAEERADYYIRAGVSRGLLRLQLNVSAPGICYLSDAGMRRYNVVNDVSE